jgi:hypothetical protein
VNNGVDRRLRGSPLIAARSQLGEERSAARSWRHPVVDRTETAMDLALLQALLLRMLAINYAILLIWLFFFVFARDFIRRTHGRWFRLSDEVFDSVHYAGMAAFKLGILLFNLTPLLALWWLR